jgi:hypothetical protein
VMTTLMGYAKSKQAAGQFKWYTMTQLANFMNLRPTASWSSGISATGRMRVTASHPSNLESLAWAYPKALYAKPVVVSGSVTIVDQGIDWLVRPVGKSAVFEAASL